MNSISAKGEYDFLLILFNLKVIPHSRLSEMNLICHHGFYYIEVISELESHSLWCKLHWKFDLVLYIQISTSSNQSCSKRYPTSLKTENNDPNLFTMFERKTSARYSSPDQNADKGSYLERILFFILFNIDPFFSFHSIWCVFGK